MHLGPLLPKSKKFSVLHLRTNAFQCKPLVISAIKPLTLKVKHLLLLVDSEIDCIALAVEIYVYLTFKNNSLEKHIFVSKVDTTGLASTHVSAAGVVKELLQYLVNIDPTVYLDGAKYKSEAKQTEALVDEPQNPSEFKLVNELLILSRKLMDDPSFYSSISYYNKSGRKPDTFKPDIVVPENISTKISLFTRSANAYLFPNSERNKGKHVADGTQLFKWWISVLDDTLDDTWICKADIPGSEDNSVQKFLPAKPNWSKGNIYIPSNSRDLAIHTIPLFPDDPKGRFLEHLIVEGRYKNTNSLDFWNELAFRQEFRLGNVVGIIGCGKQAMSSLGLEEDPQISLVTLKQYKKICDLIKSTDYSKMDDVRQLWNSELKELCIRINLEFKHSQVVGSKEPRQKVGSPSHKGENTVVTGPQTNVLNVKRKVSMVNNLTGLVKKNKKA